MSKPKHFYKSHFKTNELEIKNVIPPVGKIEPNRPGLIKRFENLDLNKAKKNYPLCLQHYQTQEGRHLLLFCLVSDLIIYEVK
jgi:hypothetical protein